MIVRCAFDNATAEADTAQAVDVSIHLRFNGPQPNAYGVPFAIGAAFEAPGVIGDTRKGGSCNFETYTLTPHCNGTHTECIGHITHERLSIAEILRESLMPAALITITPEPGVTSGESYNPSFTPSDFVITARAVEKALESITPPLPPAALVIRTQPNSPSKRARSYADEPAPFFTLEAMRAIAGLGIEHLLVDIPSLDRAADEGKLSAHRLFWDMQPGSHALENARKPLRTVTELIYVPDALPDGWYLLNLQIAPFAADAAPSRPLLYPLSFLEPTSFE